MRRDGNHSGFRSKLKSKRDQHGGQEGRLILGEIAYRSAARIARPAKHAALGSAAVVFAHVSLRSERQYQSAEETGMRTVEQQITNEKKRPGLQRPKSHY